jgi:hypothetical protein
MGDLRVMKAGKVLLVEKAPAAWQNVAGTRVGVEIAYQIHGNSVGFDVGAYDSGLELVIDPIILLSTYLPLGGSNARGVDVSIDLEGDMIAAGNVVISDDIQNFVMKIDQETYAVNMVIIGGEMDESVEGLALDNLGNAYITGYTTSEDYPLQNPIQSDNCTTYDAFVSKIDPDTGQLLFSTYFCGEGSDFAYGIEVDPNGQIYIAGLTFSADLLLSNPLDDDFAGSSEGFVAGINPNLTPAELLFSTYLGGSGVDVLYDLVLDGVNDIYVVGSTTSADYPVLNPISTYMGFSDIVLTKLNNAGDTLVYSTFLGGSAGEEGMKIALDEEGNAYLYGVTYSVDFPLVDPFQPAITPGDDQLFILKLNPAGSTILFGTYLGGPVDLAPYDIVVPEVDKVTISGYVSGDGCITAFSTGKIGSGFISQLDLEAKQLYFQEAGILPNGFTSPFGLATDADMNQYVTGQTDLNGIPLVDPLPGAFSGAYLQKMILPFTPLASWDQRLYLPLVTYGNGELYGYVTENGCGISGVLLELRFYNGAAWSTIATAMTEAKGRYSFSNIPPLMPGQFYYVRYLNPSNATRLAYWGTGVVTEYQAKQIRYLGIFDIHEVDFTSPTDGQSVPLPANFGWQPRPFPWDGYELKLIEDDGPAFWSSGLLGFTDSLIVEELPPGFLVGEAYLWFLGVHGTDGGYGESFKAYTVYFNNTGSLTAGAAPIYNASLSTRLARLDTLKLLEAQAP